MFGSVILDVAIGIIFIFILISIICSAIREGIEGLLKTRAAYLEHGIRELLHDKEGVKLASAFYTNPNIYGLFASDYKPLVQGNKLTMLKMGRSLPSYIPSRNFALAIMDIAARGPVTDEVSSDPASPIISLENMRANVANLGNPHVQRILLTAIDTAQGDLNLVQQNLEKWYESGMDRVSGWYKRSTQGIIFFIGLFAAILLNINTITIASYLSQNQTARELLVFNAEKMIEEEKEAKKLDPAAGNLDPSYKSYEVARNKLDNLSLPIGWKAGYGMATTAEDNLKGERYNATWYWNYVFGPPLGWLITAVAVMLGAPFWFDLLNKVMVIRSTVKPHEKSKEEASEDRQPPVAPQAPLTTQVTLRPPAPPNPVQPPLTVTSSPAVPGAAAEPRDESTDIDGCDVEIKDTTPDDELPEAKGGVA